MRKKRLNALLAAGCLTFLAPLSAHAAPDDFSGTYTSNTTKSVTSSEGATFTTINVSDTEGTKTTLTINAKNGTVNPSTAAGSTGTVTLNDTSDLVFSDAINNITFTKTQINGTNSITFSTPSTGTAATANLGEVTIASQKSLTLKPVAGTVSASKLNMGGSTDTSKPVTFVVDNAGTPQGSVNITEVNVSGINNKIQTKYNTSGKVSLGNIKVDASANRAAITLDNVKAANYTSIGNKATTDTKDVEYDLIDSELKNLAVTGTQKVTVKSLKGTAHNSKISTITLANGTAASGSTPANYTKLTLDTGTTAAGDTLTQIDSNKITLGSTSELATSGANTLTLKEVAINANATDAKITNTNTASGSKITTISMGDAASVALSGVKADTLTLAGAGTVTGSGTNAIGTVNLAGGGKTDTIGGITATNINFNATGNNTLNLTGNTTATTTNIVGNNKIKYNSGTVNLGNIKVDASTNAATLTFDNVKSANYTSIANKNTTDTKNVEYDLIDSELKNLAVTGTQKVTVKSLKGTAHNSKISTITLANGTAASGSTPANYTKLTLDTGTTAAGDTLTQIDSNKITLGSTSELATSGANTLTLKEVAINANATDAKITNTNTASGSKITTISMGDAASVALSGVKADTLTLAGAGTVTGSGTNTIGTVNLGSGGKTDTIGGITATNINFNATGNNTLNLTGNTTATTTNIVGNNTISYNSGTVNLGDIKVDASTNAATLNLTNIGGILYKTIGSKNTTDTKDITYNLKNSDLISKEGTDIRTTVINSGQNVTVNSQKRASGETNNKIGLIGLQAGTSGKYSALNINTGNTADGAAISSYGLGTDNNTGIIMNNYTELNLSGANAAQLGYIYAAKDAANVKIKNTSTNANTKAAFMQLEDGSKITLDGAGSSISGNVNFTSTTYVANGADDSSTPVAATTAELATANSGSAYTSATNYNIGILGLEGALKPGKTGSETDYTATLTLRNNTNNVALKASETQLCGYTDLKTEGANQINLSDVAAYNKANKLTNNNASTNIGRVDLGVLNAADVLIPGDLEIQAKNTTSTGIIYVTGTSSNASNLTLNADTGKTLTSNGVVLNGNASLNTKGAGTVTSTGGVTVRGTNNTISNTTGGTRTLNNIVIDASTANADLTLENIKSANYSATGAAEGSNKDITYNLKGSDIKGITEELSGYSFTTLYANGGQTLTINSQKGGTNQIVGDIELSLPTSGTTTLNINTGDTTNGAAISTAAIGDSDGTIYTGGNSAVNLSGANAITIAGMQVWDDANVTYKNTNTAAGNKIGAVGVHNGATLTLDGAGESVSNNVNFASETDVASGATYSGYTPNTANVTTANSGSAYSTATNYNIGNLYVKGETADSKATANLSNSTQNVVLKANQTMLDGNATIVLNGNKKIDTGSVTVYGANNQITNNNANAYIGNTSIGAIYGSDFYNANLTIQANAATNTGALTITGQSGKTSSLTLNSGTDKSITATSIGLAGNATLNTTGSGTITSTGGLSVAANTSNNTINVGNASTNLGAVNLGAGSTTTLKNANVSNYSTVTLGDNSTVKLDNTTFRTGTKVVSGSDTSTVDISGGKTVTFNSVNTAGTGTSTATVADTDLATGNASDPTTLNLKADANSSLGVGKVTMNGNTALNIQTGAGTVTVNGVKTSGTGTNIISKGTSANVSLGVLDITGTTTLSNIKTADYTNAILNDNAIVKLDNSNLTIQGNQLTAGKTNTINSTGTSTSTINNDIVLAASSSTTDKTTLVLNADTNSTLSTGKITLNDNSELDTQGHGKITINNVDVQGNSRFNNTNDNGETNFGDIVLSRGVLTTVGVGSTTYNNLVFAGGQIKTEGGGDTDIKNFTVNTNTTSPIDATGGRILYTTGTMQAGTVVDGVQGTTTLTLNAENYDIARSTGATSNTIQMNGHNQLNLNHGTTHEVILDNLEVTGTANAITNLSAATDPTQHISNIKYQATGATAELNGSDFTVSNVDLAGENTLTTKTNTTITNVAFDNSADKLNLTASNGTTGITQITTSGSGVVKMDLTAESTGQIETGDFAMSRGVINTAGTGKISLGEITASAQGNTITSNNAQTEIEKITLTPGGAPVSATELGLTPTKDIKIGEIAYSGNATTTIVSGAGALTVDKTSVTSGSANTIINNDANTNLGELTVQGDLHIESNANTTYTTANVSNGKELYIESKGGTVTATGQTTLNNGDLTLDGAGSVTLANVVVNNGTSDNNNTISKADGATTNVSLGTVTVSEGAYLNLKNIAGTNHGAVTLNNNSTVNLDSSDLGNIALANGITTTIVSKSGTSSYTTINGGTNDSGAIPLENNTVNISADNDAVLNGSNKITLGNNSVLNVGGEGTISAIAVDTTGNTEINRTNSNDNTTLGNITLTNSTLNVSGLKASDHTFKIGTNTTDSNTINATASALGSITTTNKTLNINATGAGVTFDTITLATGSSQSVPSVVNLDGKQYGFTGDSVTLQGNGTVNFKGTDSAIALTGDINIKNSNNIIDNQSSNDIVADQLNITVAKPTSTTSTVNIQGSKGFTFVNGTTIQENSNINNYNNGNVNLGTITFDEAKDKLTLNAYNGTTNVGQFVRENDVDINAIFNATGGEINKTSSTGLSNNDNLTLSGTTKITMGEITASGASSLNIENNNVKLTKVNLNDTAVLNSANNIINNLEIDELNLDDKGTATWKIDYKESTKETDSLKIGNIDTFDKKIKFEISNKIDSVPSTQVNKYVKYIKVIDADKGILGTTNGQDNISSVGTGTNQTYYSYVDGSGNYLANTIRVTNYNIMSDGLLNGITLGGNRNVTMTNGRHQANQYGGTAYPNMQVRPGDTDNSLNVNGISSLDGRYDDTSTDPSEFAQLMVVDATDPSLDKSVNRVLNFGGSSINNGLSDNSNPARVNNGAGAGLFVKTAADTGSATVTLRPFETAFGSDDIPASVREFYHNNPKEYFDDVTSEFSPQIKDTLNMDSYTESYVPEENVLYVVKDVAMSQNKANGNGGAIYNSGEKSTIITNSYSANGVQFNRNESGANGGALYNSDGATFHATAGEATMSYDMDPVTYISTGAASFDSNKAAANGGAVYNNATFTVDGNANFSNNKATGHGGAIYNANDPSREGEITTANLTGDTNTFINNTAGDASTASHGGAIYNENATVNIGNANATNMFVDNEAFGNGGAHASINNDFTVTGDTVYNMNTASGNGGAISAVGSTVSLNGSQTFTNNIAQGKGGAIYAVGSYDGDGVIKAPTVINLTANKTTTFAGNLQNATYLTEPISSTQYIDADCGHVRNEDGTHAVASAESNAIYLDGDATINLESTETGKFVFEDKIASANTNNTINQNGTAYYNNDMSAYNGMFNLNKGDAYFTDANSVPFQGGDYKLNGGTTLHLDNGVTSTIKANSLDLSGTSPENPANMTVDLDMTNVLSDHFELTKSTSGNILVTGMNTTGDPNNREEMFFPLITDAEDSESVSTVDVESVQKTYGPKKSIYEYDILGTSASGRNNGLLFKKQALDTAFEGPQVAVNARLAGQLDLYNNILHRVDEIAETRYFHKVQRTNLYAADPDVLDDSRIDNKYTPYVNQEDGGCAWIKPYATIERVSPENQSGYKSRAYNAFIGYESPVATLKNGWDLINTVFGGYQGAFQDYDNVTNYQNGGSGGYMANLYHNNFFAGGVVMMGGTNVDVQDSGKYNRDMNFGLFDIGGSARVGYNVGMGKHWLFQPMLTTSYIFITGLDRHNGRGEDIHLDGTNTIQITPGFKIVGNYSGWQPYVLFDYTWPIIAKTAATANDQRLDTLRLRSYIEYGVGLRKNFGERFVGHIETVMRNGGRNGISFQGGLIFKF